MKFHYVTDVEGDWNYFTRQIEHSEVVQFARDGTIAFKEDNEDCFVFGGDLGDRGDDIKITLSLNYLKEHYPERVVLLVGNRDANKTRFLHELPQDLNQELGSSDITKPVFAGPRAKSYPQWLRTKDTEDSAVERLKWILTTTMGAPQAFECRRNEMATLQEVSPSTISDADVYHSFRQSVEEGGIMREYLQNAQLAAVLGDTLIVHGSVTETNLLQLPIGLNGDIEKREDLSVQQWVNELNKWYQLALSAWFKNQPTGDLTKKEESLPFQYSDYTPASAIQHIAAGPGSLYKGKSVVVGNMFDQSSGLLFPIKDEVARILTSSGIRRVIVGHQPHGDTPGYVVGTNTKIKNDHSHHNIELITGDTLYGNKLANDSEQGTHIRESNPRGNAFASIHVRYEPTRELSQAHIKGIDGFGRAYQPTLDNRWPNRSKNQQDRYLGRVLTLDSIPYLVRLNSQPESGLYQLSYKVAPFSIFYKSCKATVLRKFESTKCNRAGIPNSFLSQDERAPVIGSSVFTRLEAPEKIGEQSSTLVIEDPHRKTPS